MWQHTGETSPTGLGVGHMGGNAHAVVARGNSALPLFMRNDKDDNKEKYHGQDFR